MDIEAIRNRQSARRKRMQRTPAARQFDRNCILAMTAGQLLAARVLEVPVRSIIVSDTLFETGPTARDIRLREPRADASAAIIAAAGTLAFAFAAGMALEDVRDGYSEEMLGVSTLAEVMLTPSIVDGSFAKLAIALGVLRQEGERLL